MGDEKTTTATATETKMAACQVPNCRVVMWFRRRKCRRCGVWVCKQHSKNKMYLDAKGNQTVDGGRPRRVCDCCYSLGWHGTMLSSQSSVTPAAVECDTDCIMVGDRGDIPLQEAY